MYTYQENLRREKLEATQTDMPNRTAIEQHISKPIDRLEGDHTRRSSSVFGFEQLIEFRVEKACGSLLHICMQSKHNFDECRILEIMDYGKLGSCKHDDTTAKANLAQNTQKQSLTWVWQNEVEWRAPVEWGARPCLHICLRL